MDECALAERLISYDTSRPEQIHAAASFVHGWLERDGDLAVSTVEHNGLPVIVAEVGPDTGPCVVFHGHIDVVPAFATQFVPAGRATG